MVHLPNFVANFIFSCREICYVTKMAGLLCSVSLLFFKCKSALCENCHSMGRFMDTRAAVFRVPQFVTSRVSLFECCKMRIGSAV